MTVVAFGGAGIYWLVNLLNAPTERFATDTEKQTRRGFLNPLSTPNVKIAKSCIQQNNDSLSRFVILRKPNSIPPKTLPSAVPQDQNVETTPEYPMELAVKSNCKALPGVSWWRVKTHIEIVRFINQKHGRNWQSYLDNWRARIFKSQDISLRGSGIKTSSV